MNKKELDHQKKFEPAMIKVQAMSVEDFQTQCEEHNIKCWEMDHMIYDLAQALVKSKSNGKS